VQYPDLGARFMRYAAINTQSREGVDTTPSTECQFELARVLRDELLELGAADVSLDEQYCYVYGTIPAAAGCEDAPVLGLMAHMDIVDDVPGPEVRPRRVPNYDGGDIVLNEDLGIVTRADDFPVLKAQAGHDLIVCDGTTVLGGDDKAGVAAIMDVAEKLLTEPGHRHGKIIVCFTPDEEVGNGPLNLDYDRFRCDYAYTVDGNEVSTIEYENFNAAALHLTVHGRNTHPGYAKGLMKNALTLFTEFNAMLPPKEVPECTEGYEGFYHIIHASGTPEEAEADYIIRDFDMDSFQARKQYVTDCVAKLNEQYGAGTFEANLRDQYYNMKEKIEPVYHLVENAMDAMRAEGLEPQAKPIRGGTDGCQISYKGIPCPNLGTGAYLCHSRHEFVNVDEMKTNVCILLRILASYVGKRDCQL